MHFDTIHFYQITQRLYDNSIYHHVDLVNPVKHNSIKFKGTSYQFIRYNLKVQLVFLAFCNNLKIKINIRKISVNVKYCMYMYDSIFMQKQKCLWSI